jgi:two-component system, OmpR family, phosphate regulon sensor histidine kinase PhoR
MRKKPFYQQILVSFLMMMVSAILLTSWYASNSISNIIYNRYEGELDKHCNSILSELESNLSDDSDLIENYSDLNGFLAGLSFGSNLRITLILPNGNVIADTHESPQVMENHAHRPEIADALVQGKGKSKRRSPTLDKLMLYNAVSFKSDTGDSFVLRCSYSLVDLNKDLWTIQFRIIVCGAFVLILTALIAYAVSRRIARPLEYIRFATENYANRSTGLDLPESDIQEVSTLSEALNRMAFAHEQRFIALARQKNEREALLNSMREGVIALDEQRRILSHNKSAEQLLQLGQHARGALLVDLVEGNDLDRLFELLDNKSATTQLELELNIRKTNRSLLFYATPMLGPLGEQFGYLLVFNDMTEMKRLAEMRSEFVSNVSHELRTPVTSIKGFVEILRDGAIENTALANKFLLTIERQTNRLGQIIDDLLSLSRLERNAEQGSPLKSNLDIDELCRIVLADYKLFASEKSVKLELHCEKQLNWNANQHYLERALINLVVNAVNYSKPDTKVMIHVNQIGDSLQLEVSDFGCGINAEHLPRIFERFFVVDKARSRRLGGTGLGLSIVKHCIVAQGGQVGVESTPGVGSSFWLKLPA